MSSSWILTSLVMDCQRSLPYLYSSRDFLRFTSKSVSLETWSFSSLISENSFARFSAANAGKNEGGVFLGSCKNDLFM